MKVVFVWDGPRDESIVPALAGKVLGRQLSVSKESGAWSDIRLRSPGYGRKLEYFARVAADTNAAGLIATIDRDRAGTERLEALREGRQNIRNSANPATSLPIPVGEARPHAEAWLLDDEKAVRDGLSMSPDDHVPGVDVESPRDALDSLIAASDVLFDDKMDALRSIAENVDPRRALHRDATGFAAFEAELLAEFRQLS